MNTSLVPYTSRIIPLLAISVLTLAIGCQTVSGVVPGASTVADASSSDSDATDEPAALDPKPTEGFLNDVHEAHAGQIVFASEPITRESSDQVTFQDRFSLTDPIYHRIWLADSMGNEFRKAGAECLDGPHSRQRMLLRMDIDGLDDTETMNIANYGYDSFHEWTSMIPYEHSITGVGEEPMKLGDPDREFEARFVGRILPLLGPGEYEVTFTAVAECHLHQRDSDANNRPVASGSFTLVIEDQDTLDQVMYGAGLDLPEPMYADQSDLENTVITELERMWTADQPLEFATTDTGWTISYHEVSGVPENRALPAKVLVKGGETNRCRILEIAIYQTYLGDERYSSDVEIGVAMSDPIQVPCPRD